MFEYLYPLGERRFPELLELLRQGKTEEVAEAVGKMVPPELVTFVTDVFVNIPRFHALYFLGSITGTLVRTGQWEWEFKPITEIGKAVLHDLEEN